MAMLTVNPSAPTYEAALAELVAKKWEVVSEGPSGAQLRGPKSMRALDKGCAVVGVAAAFLNVFVGAFLILVAVVDYLLLTKHPTHFLNRAAPILPGR